MMSDISGFVAWTQRHPRVALAGAAVVLAASYAGWHIYENRPAPTFDTVITSDIHLHTYYSPQEDVTVPTNTFVTLICQQNYTNAIVGYQAMWGQRHFSIGTSQIGQVPAVRLPDCDGEGYKLPLNTKDYVQLQSDD